ncbi:MAG: hypothetical protein GY851_12365 [bacterium]|nr:hypothetical protein [bacterium]
MPKMSRSEQKMAMRDQAKQKVRGGYGRGTNTGYRDGVEKGRKQLQVQGSVEGDSAAKKAKNELHYLLNNYLPQYDNRIQHLIDIWRRSGDPGYSPEIAIRYRRARQEHMRKSTKA